MSLDLDTATVASPSLKTGVPVELARAAPALWCVLDPSGRVIGHLQALSLAGGIRYRARRFHGASRAFRELGEFWSADDAIDCLRFAR